MKYLIAFLTLITFAPSLCAQTRFNPDERRIIQLVDERRNADSVAEFLDSRSSKVAWRAAIGLANIGDTTVRATLLAHLKTETRDSVAEAEAFALGMLGVDRSSFQQLVEIARSHPTRERITAMARIAPREFTVTCSKLLGGFADNNMIGHLTEAKCFVEIALRKDADKPPRMMDDVELLSGDNDPQVRWRAAYVFARMGDSSDLRTRIPRLKELLIDQGTPNARMFAATAFGRLHDESAETILTRAYRGEQEWRVRVNILNAFSRFALLDSSMLEILKTATMNARSDDPTSTQLGIVAQNILEGFVRAGKIPVPLLDSVRAWLGDLNDPDNYPEMSPVVLAAATPAAVLLRTKSFEDALKNFGQARDVQERYYSLRGLGETSDTAYFANLLESMSFPYLTPLEQLWRLEALDSMWHRAQYDPEFKLKLERSHFANLYRHLLIRVSSLITDPAVVTTALDQVRDSTIVTDTSFRNEAIRYNAGYLRNFSDRGHRDQLMSAVQAELWLLDTSRATMEALRIAGDSAQQWRDDALLDSVEVTYRRLHWPHKERVHLWRTSHIDWNYIESMPDRMTINLEKGSVELQLLTYYAPLTVYNMVLLAKEQYFANQKVHRVVPNFVIQSGDPTGTGWGGPGFVMRSEFTPLEYDREGVAGMASDGKDTEGSQWFITECPTPHLDKRYTIWATVTGGMSTVMKVLQGDKVETIVPYR